MSKYMQRIKVTRNNANDSVFSARHHNSINYMPSALSPAYPSVCLSVFPSVTRVDQSKTVEVSIMKISP